MVGTSYTPERGDIIWLNFTPQSGYEQAGRRPALVMSPVAYNRKVGLALVCPITPNVKGYPFEVELPEGMKAQGAVLCDQIRSLDWRTRQAERYCPAPIEVVKAVTAKVLTLVSAQ